MVAYGIPCLYLGIWQANLQFCACNVDQGLQAPVSMLPRSESVLEMFETLHSFCGARDRLGKAQGRCWDGSLVRVTWELLGGLPGLAVYRIRDLEVRR